MKSSKAPRTKENTYNSISYYKHNNSGRSLTEMLATLAIYGIITITGITGFRYLMNKHTANTILSEAQMHATLLAGNALTQGVPENVALNNIGYAFTYKKESDTAYSLNLTGIDKSVCKILWGTRDLGWAETVLLNNGADCTDENTITFYINTNMTNQITDNNRITPCESDTDCGECGTCSTEQKVCVYSDSLCPNSDKSYCNKGTCQACEVGKFKGTDEVCYECTNLNKRPETTEEECHNACPNRIIINGMEGTSDYNLIGALKCTNLSDTTRSWYYTSEEECNRANNLKINSISWYSVRYKHKTLFNTCLSCSRQLNNYQNTSNYYTTSFEQCQHCENNCYSSETQECFEKNASMKDENNDGYCDTNCPKNQVIFINFNRTADYNLTNGWPRCTDLNFEWLYMHEEECKKAQQLRPNTFFAIKYKDKDFFNVCLLCARSDDVATYKTTKEHCDQCSNRYFSDGNCIICPDDISGLTAEQQAQCTPETN